MTEERPRLRCLKCGYTFYGYKSKTKLSWRQCPRPECRSYSVIEADLFDSIVEEVLRMRRRRGWPFPILTLLVAILRQRGITLKPLQTLHLAMAVEQEVYRRKSHDEHTYKLKPFGD